MFILIDGIATVNESGTYYVGDVSFIIEQKSHKLVTEKLVLFNDTLFVNLYSTMTKSASVIKERYIKTVPVISNIGITLLKNAYTSKFKDDNSIGVELKLTKGDTIKIIDKGFDGIYLVFCNAKEYAKIPLNFKRD